MMRSPHDIRLRDPLSEVTRTERKFLLAVSAIGLTVLHAGIVPNKIEALGIEFSRIDQGILLKALGAVIAYFLCAFLVYAVSDFVAWRRDFHQSRRDGSLELLRRHAEYESLTRLQRSETGPYRSLDSFQKSQEESQLLLRAEFPVSLLRACFEFLVPIALGLVACIQLFLS